MSAVLRPYVADPRRALADRVVFEVTQAFYVNEHEVWSRSRTPSVVAARQIAFYILWRVFGWSSPETGRVFGFDHTVVLYGRNKIAHLVGADLMFGAEVERVVTRLRGAS